MVKYRGRIQISKELTREIIGLPEDVDFDGIQYDMDQETYSVFISTNEEKFGWTFAMDEDSMTPRIHAGLLERRLIERAVEMIRSMPAEQTNELFSKLLVKEDF